jgi:hypothetical protein
MAGIATLGKLFFKNFLGDLAGVGQEKPPLAKSIRTR